MHTIMLCVLIRNGWWTARVTKKVSIQIVTLKVEK